MKKDGSPDLRVVKTEEAIQRVFKEMICEMDYEDLTIKELTERARINRKTFYLHYESLDALLLKLQEEIAATFIQRNISYRSMEDIRSITRTFFEYAASMPMLNERLLCSGSYSRIGDRINAMIMEHRAKTNRGAFSEEPLVDNLVFAYFSAVSTILYRQWVADGKRLPLEDLIQAATRLICSGMSGFVKESRSLTQVF